MIFPRYLLSFGTENIPSIECDVLVAGSGVAGLSAALEISKSCKVLLVTKSGLLVSSTRHAQGGIAAVIDPDDTIESHIEDTLVTGVGLSDPEATELLVNEGPKRVVELLEDYETDFDMSDGHLDLAKEGGHSRARVVHAKGDATGAEVERSLGKALLRSDRVGIMEDTLLVDLMVEDGRCAGALVMDARRGALFAIWSRAVVLSSGGMGEVFLVTTNPSVCTGDGVSAAFRAGARVSDVEFVQFHPTAFHIPEVPKFLISEALRGDGALLVDDEGNRIMDGVHPLGELAPRDIVVAKMVEVMKSRQTNHLYLDVRHIDPDRLKKRFPNIYDHCLEAGIDITENKIPVSPAAHFMSGGVITDLWGETDIKGLFACGEVACTGVHGANRLASNSLLEGLVFARRISVFLRENMDFNEPLKIRDFSYDMELSKTKVQSDLLRGNLREIMLDSVGMLRNRKGLTEAEEFFQGNSDLLGMEFSDVHSLELKNMFTLGYLIATAALTREETRGCHRRRDFPDLDDWSWKKHIDMRNIGDKVEIEYRPQASRSMYRDKENKGRGLLLDYGNFTNS